MNLKNVYVEAKKSKNFQTYTVGGTIEVPNDKEIADELIREAQTRCRKLVMEQIEIDSK